MNIHVLDTETTGLDPESDRVVELAAVLVCAMPRAAPDATWDWEIGEPVASLVKPHRPISFEAMGVHHITEADVANAPDLGPAIDLVLTPFWGETVDVIAAHNAKFDKPFLPPLKDKRWVCTWRCARHVWPDAPSYGNGSLFYWLGGARPAQGHAHGAGFDATMTAFILVKLLAERSVDDLLALSRKAVLLKKVGFGKHFGQLWADVPGSYLEWASKQDFEADEKFTIKSEIARRKKAAETQDDLPNDL